MPATARPRRIDHVVIIGAGFSGALQAINLIRHDGPRTTLIERRSETGRGVAYSAAHPSHLLNVRAANMSALPDDPDHFVRWLAENRPEQPGGFVPRTTYGDYLADLLADVRARAAGRLVVRHNAAVDVRFAGGRAEVSHDDGTAIDSDAVVLALGNLPPHEVAGIGALGDDPDRYVADPWSGDIANGLSDDDTVLLIGSGLTMVDAALLLEARGFGGKIIAMSRRGLLPHAHVEGALAVPTLGVRPTTSPAGLLRFVRVQAEAAGWRAAVDALRPFTQDLWLAADAEQQARFLRHLRPWWDIHRHRLAPAVADRINTMRARGALDIVAGKLRGFEQTGRGVAVAWRPRGKDVLEQLSVRRIVNCSGPQGDLDRTAEPLLRRLLERGLIRPGAQGLGMDVNQQAETIGVDGRANPGLLALGPMTRGAFWEIVAVPDIRVQTWSVARRLSNAHWVEGEGL